jgi:prevent-host-death family protein
MDRDHGTIERMDTITVSRFKATCLARLERVHQTGRPLLITKRGVPIAQVLPPPVPDVTGSGFGVMAGTVVEHADIVEPVDETEWEANL